MPASEEIERAATLKVEGNALFAEKSYYEAIDKYTQAIGLDGENAILYSNRAACYIILDSFGPAALDALKATTFNSTYVKAWARLAIAQQGLQDYRKAVKSWTRALAVLPNDNPTPADVKQREEYEKSLQQATRLAATHGTWDLSKIDASGSMLLFNSEGKKLPGQRAREMVSRLKARNITRSSAFVIAEAYEDYHTGLGRLDKVSMIAVPGSSMARARGMTGVIELLTNAILQDERSCIIPSPEFQQKMNSQIKMEMVGARSPQDPRNFDMFTNEIRRLHAEGGFELSRLAFSTPVRIMLCQAFMDEAGSDHHEAAIELYDYVLKLLRWGQEEYPDVSRELRGPVLEETFINGIRGLRLTSYMKAHNMNRTSCTITLNGLLEEADSLIESVRAHPPQASEPGFNLAFGDYLEAHALAMKGYVWSHRAREAKYTDAREVQEGRVQLKTSGDFYFAAARKLPADEENHAWYFKAGLDQYYSGSAPLSITLPLLERLLSAITLSQEIWQFSQITYELQGELYEALETFDTKIRHAIKEGAFNLDAFAAPPWASPKHVFGDALEKATAGPMTYL